MDARRIKLIPIEEEEEQKSRRTADLLWIAGTVCAVAAAAALIWKSTIRK